MKVNQTIILVISFLTSFTVFPQDNNIYKLFEHAGYNFPYKLAMPDRSWVLPIALVEISGLSFIDNSRLACIQDEKGDIYIFNLTTGVVDSKIHFDDDGDYEDIEVIDHDAWVLKSNGTLYKVAGYLNKAIPDVKKHATALSGKNDTEGLAYDPVNKNLLIACKGYPFVNEKKGNDVKAVYIFNLKTKRLNLKPFLLIETDTIKYYKNYNTITRLGIELLAAIDPSKGDVTFQPSGIAIQPVTGNIFILGSVGNLLIVLSGNGKMLALITLSPKIFPKPEGICFSPDGKLFIANEGDGKAGTILKFELKNK
jgi:uncharacterized protein YjiK